MQTIVFGAGCFWCSEASLEILKGVESVKSGYAGGKTKDPTYEQVCSGETGHAEVVRVEYNEKNIRLEKLLDVFFAIHDPSSLNRQGNDVGSQYRSIILYTSDKQKEEVAKYMRKAAKLFEKPMVTEVKRLDKFYPAELEHDNFYANNPLNPYCALVISPKITKVMKKFGPLV